MRRHLATLAALLVLHAPLAAQSGPWAKYDAKMKGDALVRDSDGGYLNEVKSIVEGGGDVNYRLEPSGLTPLMAAATAGHVEIVRFLLAKGARPEARDAHGMTALDRAVRDGHKGVVALLRASAAAAPAAALPPTTKAAPVVANTPATAPATPTAPAARGAVATPNPSRTAWAPFGSYRPGQRVQFRVSTGWRAGTITEVGTAAPPGKHAAAVYEKRYRIASDKFPDNPEWVDWGSVAGLAREPFWTGFFVGDWMTGEVMAVNTRRGTSVDTTTYSYHAATEALRVNADGTYLWKPLGERAIRGRWAAAPDGPGIVLKAGSRGRDWTLRNETNAMEEGIRGIETARLTTEGIMSITAKRPVRRR